MDELTLIGIGTGNPDHLTLQGIAAMRAADLVLIPRKGTTKADLADLRRAICARVLGDDAPIVEFDMPRRDADGDYLDAVDAWHDAIARAWTAAGAQARRVALLIWGDPSLYDSALRIAARLAPAPRLRVVPGITALQALCAAHRIPLNDIGAPVLVTTGRRLRAEGWPPGAGTVAVMLDSGGAYESLYPAGITIWWGAYLGMPQELTLAGPLAELAPRIAQTRAAARARHGWIMDIYLMRRTDPAAKDTP
ncbi:precorrin-6A synthase (deacetylating) [Rhodobaculum claviforme]|uniref:Precorrin-6A synthase [deacetylating] n=1 Tax=Rhodobaculum claviforme TaxID=1549854 RepID=A0A934TJK0_9RHOB|nr:precorrin-6A synthase (deacetylating) [Rhodobaculum claviforme]MBK5926691.1 precorrin-6A synthase (deacetylating) [Rhodobaculum claviforme]